VPVCFYKLFKKKNDFKINFKDLKPEREDVGKIAKFATPSAISQALASLGFLILQGFILSYGDETAAAFSLGNKISNLLLLPIMALGSILAAYVGQNIGARNKDRAKQAYKTSKTLSLVISIVGVLILIPIRHSALGLLTNDNTTLEIASEYVIWVLITQPLMGLFQNYLGVFNGSGNTSFSFIMATVRLWLIRLPMLLIMKNIFEMDRSCIWITMNVSNLLILFLGAYLYKKVDYEPKIKVNKIEA
jgi:putative MATE family efflux protein